MTSKKRFNSNAVLFHALESLVDYRLRELREYFKAIEDRFEKDKAHIKKRHEKEVDGKSLDPAIAQDIAEYYGEELHKIDEIFLTNLRYAMTVSTYSVFENLVMNLCGHLCHLKKIRLALNELRGDGILRSKLYLSKVCMVDFPEESHEWQEILKLNKVRNCIVHALGKVGAISNEGAFSGVIKNTKGLRYDSTGKFIRIERSYVISSIGCVRQFAHTILNAAFEALEKGGRD